MTETYVTACRIKQANTDLPSWGFALTALHFPCMGSWGGSGRPRYGRAMSPAPLPYDNLRPVTITPDRYGGTYSGGAWLAFPLHPSEVPDDPFGGDVFAATWWDELGDRVPVGRGDSPSGAYDDLVGGLRQSDRRGHTVRPANLAARCGTGHSAGQPDRSLLSAACGAARAEGEP